MSKNILLNGETYNNVSTVQLPTTTGSTASFKDTSEIIVPSGTLNIDANGTHDVREYANVLVNVASSDTGNSSNIYLDILEQQGIVGELVESSLTNVRMYAFAGSGLMTSASLLNAEKLYDYSFNACSVLANVNIPKCTYLGSFAFNGCKVLASINAPLVESVGASVFYTCSALTDIELPKCTVIKTKAFGFCTSLNSITLSSPTMCTLENVDAFRNINKTIQIRVPADLVTTYQSDATWSAVEGAVLEFVAIQ